MARKPKIVPEEQRRRFEEAARAAGVDDRPETLKRIVCEIAPNKRLMEELREAKAAEGDGALEKRMRDINRALKKKRPKKA
jgi:hypothetical protein